MSILCRRIGRDGVCWRIRDEASGLNSLAAEPRHRRIVVRFSHLFARITGVVTAFAAAPVAADHGAVLDFVDGL